MRLACDQGAERAHVNVPKRNWTVVALEHERVLGCFGNRPRGASRSFDVDVLLYELPVEEHTLEPRGLDLLS